MTESLTWSGGTRPSKPEWRAELLRARRAVPREVRAADAAALAAALAEAVARLPGDTVCGYLPVGSEPGSGGMLDVLVEAGRRVLLPVVTGPHALDWAVYTGPGNLAPGPHRLLEPTGPRLGRDAIGLAGTVLVPALAVDRGGVRLGRGAGHYDRSLPHAAAGTAFVVVVRDEELVRQLPAEPHDVLMSAVLTPGHGVRALPLA